MGLAQPACRVLAALACLGACSAPARRPSANPPATPVSHVIGESSHAAEVSTPLALVGGEPIATADLLRAWLHRDSLGVRALLDELILSRLVLLEAARLGIDVPEVALKEAREAAFVRLEEEVASSGSTLSTQDFLRRRMGLNPVRYRERLEREAELDLLSERVVRAWLLSSERALVRVIVLDEQSQASEVQARLDAGEEFGLLAGRYSVEDSGALGGRVPPVVRGSSSLARLAFSTPVGQVSGPVQEGGRWLFLLVDDRPGPFSGDGAALTAAVEASLQERPIEDPEFWQWKADVVLRHQVDMAPFFRLVGPVVVE